MAARKKIGLTVLDALEGFAGLLPLMDESSPESVALRFGAMLRRGRVHLEK